MKNQVFLAVLSAVCSVCSPVDAASEQLHVCTSKTWMTELNDGFHVWVHPDTMTSLGISAGEQVRLTRAGVSDEYAVYTVIDPVQSLDCASYGEHLRLAQAGRERLGTTSTFDAVIDTVIHCTSCATEAAALSANESIEVLDDDGSYTGLLIAAPHGGHIEPDSDDIAEDMFDALALASFDVSYWGNKGFKSGGGASDRWHITSTEMSPNSYPLLGSIASRGFERAISFHGFSGSAEVVIGGAGPLAVKTQLLVAISSVLGCGYSVTIAQSGDPLSGMSANNFVNWITDGGDGGIQIEMSLDVRQTYGAQLAVAIAGVYAGLL